MTKEGRKLLAGCVAAILFSAVLITLLNLIQ